MHKQTVDRIRAQGVRSPSPRSMAEHTSLDVIFPEWRLNECYPRDPGVIDGAWNGEKRACEGRRE